MSLSIFYLLSDSLITINLFYIFICIPKYSLPSLVEGQGEGLPLLYNSHPTLIGRAHHAGVCAEALAHQTVAGDGCHGA